MRPVPVHDRRALEPAEHLERNVRRDRVDEDEAARTRARRRDRVEHDDVGLTHAALVLIGRADVERNLRIGSQNFLEEQIARAHQEHGDLSRRRQDRVGHVIDGEVVVDADPRRDGAAATVAERHHHRSAYVGLERHFLFSDRLAVELEPERERLGLVRVVHERHERLIVEGAVVVLADRQTGDRDVLALLSDTDPPNPRIGGVLALRQGERAVGEDMDLGARIGRDERARGPHRLDQPGGKVAGLRRADRAQRPFAIARHRRRNFGLHAGLDHHHLGALAEPPHERGRTSPRRLEP